MDKIKTTFATITIIFAGLGLLNILPDNIANPIMLAALGTLLLISSTEYKKENDKGAFILTLVVSMFLYSVIVYNLVFSR